MKRIIATVFTFSLLLLILTACGGKKVDLTDAYNIYYSGIDGEGTASITIKENTMEKQLNLKLDTEKDLKYLFALVEFVDSVKYSIEPAKDLSNGQSIKIKCEWDKEVAKRLGLAPVFKESTVVIPEDAFRVIRKLTEEEVFDNVEVQVSGIYPNLEVTAANKEPNEITKKIRYSLEETNFKSNYVVVSASMSDYDADSLSVSLSPMTKKFEITGYSKYIDKATDVDKKSKEKILAQAQNVVVAHFENEKTQNVYFSDYFPYASSDAEFAQRKLEDIRLDRVFFLNLRDGMEPNYAGSWGSTPIYNQTIFLYHVKLYHHKAPEGIDYFIPIFLNNIVKLSTQELDYQLANIFLNKRDIRNIVDDYKSLYLNSQIDKYDGQEISAENYMK